MKSRMLSIFLYVIIITSISTPITVNVGQESSSSNEIGGLPLLNISEPTPQIVGQSSPNLSKTEEPVLSTISTPILQIVGQSSLSLSRSGNLADSPWPMFRGNLNHTGQSSYDTSGNNGQLKWSFLTRNGVYSSPAIDNNGTIYVGSEDYKLYAINPDGSEKWNFSTNFPVRSSPAINSNGTIYFGSRDNKLYAINPDGSEKWNFATGGDVRSSPTIGFDGTIYVGSWDHKLYAINPDGTEKWSFKTGYTIDSSPAISSEGTIYLGSYDFKLYAINPNGTEKWNFTTGGQVRSSPAIGSDGTIYIGSGDHNMYAINPDGTQKWCFITGNHVFSSPAIGSDGTIYVGSNDNNLYAINTDGTEKWKFTSDGWVHSSPAIGFDGTIYVGSGDDYIYAINPDGTEKWKYNTSGNISGYGNVESSPAIGFDGTIYVGSWEYQLYAIGTSDQPPIPNAGSDQTVNEGNIVELDASASYDLDGTIETYEWDFESDGIYDYIETINSSPDGTFDRKTTHIYGDNGMYIVTLRVTDDDGLKGSDTCNVTVNNDAPIIDALTAVTINEFENVTLTGHATDLGSDDLTFTWNWGYTPWGDKTTIYYNDGLAPDPYPSPTINPRNITEVVTCQYGDDGIFSVTLTVTDDDGGSTTVMTNVTVNNVDPTVTIESITMDVEIGLRVAGRKYNYVSMVLYEDGSQLGYVSIERLPGSPNEQMAWIPVSINFSKSYSTIVTYTPEDPPNVGGNPVWIYIKSRNGSIKEMHHTFNVQQSKKRDSEHWNHVEPWEVDLNSFFIGLPFEITSDITDPGSDDEILTYTYGSQVIIVIYQYNPPNPDPYPSPEANPRDITNSISLTYEGSGTVILIVKDDDNVRSGIGQGTDSIIVG